MTLPFTLILGLGLLLRQLDPLSLGLRPQQDWGTGTEKWERMRESLSLLVVCWVHYGWAMVRATNLSVVAEVTHCTMLWRLQPWPSFALADKETEGDIRALNCGFRALEQRLISVTAVLETNSLIWLQQLNAARCKWLRQVIFGPAEADDDLNEWKWGQRVCCLRARYYRVKDRAYTNFTVVLACRQTWCSAMWMTQNGGDDSVGKWSKVEFASGRVNLDHKQPVIQDWSKTGVCGFQSSLLYSIFLKVMFGLVVLHYFLPRQESTWQQSALSDNYIHDIS